MKTCPSWLSFRTASLSLGATLGLPLVAGASTAVNFHYAHNYAGGAPNYPDIVYSGQGAYSDPGNDLWNGFGPGYSANVNGSNLTSAGSSIPVTLDVVYGGANGGIWLSGDGTNNPNQGTPFFLLGYAALVNGANPGAGTADAPMGTFTLHNVPTATYDLYLYGANYDSDRGAHFAVSSGTADSGIDTTFNNHNNNTFVEGENYVIFHNVTPNASGDISGSFIPMLNPNTSQDGEANFNGLQLVTNDVIVIQPEWGVDSSGDWNQASNWIGGVPNGVGAVAKLLSHSTAPHTVFTDSPVTIGTLRMENTSTYVIAGLGDLTMQVGTGAASINVSGAAQKINLPLSIASNTNVNVDAGATLTIGNPLTVQAGKTLATSGNVLIQAPMSIGNGGAMVINSGPASIFGAPSLGTGAKIDVKNNTLQVDYHGLSGTTDAIKTLLHTGANGGAWNGTDGITTSSATTGQTGLGWKDDTANQTVTIKFTYLGDANLDGQVDVTDLGALATSWQTSNVWSGGDFNYDGFVDVTDLGALATNWQKGVGSPLGPGSLQQALAAVGLGGVSVPEPASIGVLGLAMGLLGTRSRRRRK